MPPFAGGGEKRLQVWQPRSEYHVLRQTELPCDVIRHICSFLPHQPRGSDRGHVRSLLCAVRNAWGVPIERQRLLFDGVVLDP